MSASNKEQQVMCPYAGLLGVVIKRNHMLCGVVEHKESPRSTRSFVWPMAAFLEDVRRFPLQM